MILLALSGQVENRIRANPLLSGEFNTIQGSTCIIVPGPRTAVRDVVVSLDMDIPQLAI